MESPLDVGRWLSGARNEDTAVLVGGDDDDLFNLLEDVRALRPILVVDRAVARCAAETANARFRNAPAMTMTRGLRRDLATLGDERTDRAAVFPYGVVFEAARHSAVQLRQQSSMLAGYEPPAAVLAACARDCVVDAIGAAARRTRRPLVLHDVAGLLATARLKDVETFRGEPRGEDPLGALIDAAWTGATPRQGDPSRDDVLAHAEFLAKAEEAEFLQMHAFLRDRGADGLTRYWRSQISAQASAPEATDVCRRAMARLDPFLEAERAV